MRAIALAAAGFVAVGVLQAQEPPREGQSAPPVSAAPAPAASTAPASPPPANGKPAPQGAATPAPATGGRTPERFEPTEKLRADFDVSFPVDI